MGTFRVAAGPAARAAHPEPPWHDAHQTLHLARQANLPSYLLYITRGLPRQELIVLHNTGLPAGRVLAAAEAFQVVPGPALWDSSELHRARPLGVGGACRCARNKTKTAPPFLRRKDSPASETPKRKPLPRMDNGFSYFQMYGKKISLALVIVSIMEHPAVTVHII